MRNNLKYKVDDKVLTKNHGKGIIKRIDGLYVPYLIACEDGKEHWYDEQYIQYIGGKNMSSFSKRLKDELAAMDKELENRNLSGEERYNKSTERFNKATELLAVIEDENAGNQYEME